MVVEVKETLYVDGHAYDGVDVDAFQFSYMVAVANFYLARLKISNPILFEAYLLDL